MLLYLLKRLLAMVPTLLGITFVTFMIVNLAPGDPVATSIGGGGGDGGGEAAGGNQDRLGDAIKAKKKLLGMVREDYTAHRVGVAGPALEVAERLGELPGWARALALSPDGRTLVLGGDQGALVALDAETGAQKMAFVGHSEAVWAVALSADGATLVSADTDGQLRAWSTSDGAPRAEGRPLNRPVRDLVIRADGSEVISACDDGQIRRHRLPDLNETGTLSGHNSGVYALALSADGARLWSGGYDRTLRAWDLSSGSLVGQWSYHGAGINDLALSPDGRRLASASDDRVARVVDVGNLDAAPIELKGHYKRVGAVAWLDDQRVLTGGDDESLRLWDVAGAAEVAHSAESVGKVGDIVTSGGTAWSAAESWVTVPIPVRYIKWLGRILTFDFDRSFLDNRPVIEKIGDALPITLGLNLIAICIIYIISIPLGILSAVRRGSTFDNISSFLLFVLYSIPNFWLATLLIMTFSSVTSWDLLPSVGLISDNADDLSFLQWVWDGFKHLVLPITVMTYAGFASLSRYVRTSLLETIQEDYVRTARAKGLDAWTVILKHAFRNSLVTIVTLVANLLPGMIGGSVIVEAIFSIQGMGKLGFEAILARDYPVVMAITTFSAFLTLLGVLLSDLLYSVVDPRARLE